MRIETITRNRSTDWVLQFINIVFLLLVYFLVNGSIGERPQAGILLPEAATAGPGLPPHDALYLDEQGQIFYGGRQLDPAGLAPALSGAPRSHKLIVAADRHLSATVLLDRLAELRRLGFLQVSVLAVRGDGA